MILHFICFSRSLLRSKIIIMIEQNRIKDNFRNCLPRHLTHTFTEMYMYIDML